MENYTTNEQSLLFYLEEESLKTNYQLVKEVEVYNYWASGQYKKDEPHLASSTYEQIDFYITNSQNRIKPLRFRMNWLETQINEVKNNLDNSK